MRTKKPLKRQIKESVGKKPAEQSHIDPRKLIPSGSTLLNLACSDSIHGAFKIGEMVNIIGDSHSGKTLGLLSLYAEMVQHARFDKYRMIYDDVEAANQFNIAKLFSEKAKKRIEALAFDECEQPSGTIQEFKATIARLAKQDNPFVYGLDSLDALTSDEEVSRMEKELSGKEVGGSYKMEKPKVLGELLRMVIRDIRKTNSLLVIISQTRANINPMSFAKKTRSGGDALRFYASHEIWLGLLGKIKSKDRVIGARVRVKITKNKLTGKVREVEFPIYYDYGIDDIGSCIDFLIEEGVWSGKKSIEAEGLGLRGTREKLIKKIEEENLEGKLRHIVGKAWKNIEDSLSLKRKPKYQ